MPILESRPTVSATSEPSAPTASQTADIALTEEILWARKAFAANFANSLDQVLNLMILSLGIKLR